MDLDVIYFSWCYNDFLAEEEEKKNCNMYIWKTESKYNNHLSAQRKFENTFANEYFLIDHNEIS